MLFLSRCGNGEASCTKSLSIDFKELTIKLDHNHQLIINGDEIVNLPYQTPAVQIFMVSSLFMQVILPSPKIKRNRNIMFNNNYNGSQ